MDMVFCPFSHKQKETEDTSDGKKLAGWCTEEKSTLEGNEIKLLRIYLILN